MYLAAYARRPTPEEAERIRKFIAQQRGTPVAKSYSDVIWALLNSAEFFVNH